MAITTETNFYRYIISEFTIIYPDATTTKLEFGDILGLGIEKDYDHLYYPLLNIQLLLDYKTYYKIFENKTDVKFKFKFGKYIMDKSSLDSVSTSKKYIENIFDCTFGIYPEDNIMATDKELYEKTQKALSTGEQALSRKPYEFYLFKDSDLKTGKYTTNCVLSNCNMTDTLVYLFSKSKMKNLLMSPLDNSKKYSEVVVPYIPLIQTVNFLEQHYGFYKAGSLLFFDFDTTYFISKYEKNVYRSGEFNNVTMTFFKPGSTNSITPGSYKDKSAKKIIIHISQDNMTPSTNSIISEQTSGTNAAMINSSSDNVNVVEPSVSTRGGSTTKVILNKYENPYLNTMTMFNKLQNEKIIDVLLYDVDIAGLAPNKIYNFSFDDKATHKMYGGKYRLVSAKYIFEKQGNDFSITVQARFKTIGFKQKLVI